VTAGNASGINDGAAMLLVCDERFAADHGQRPLAYLSGGSLVGCDPRRWVSGPCTRRGSYVQHSIKASTGSTTSN
jgi:acetyl-CoA C-acetyltransferase